MAAATFVDCRNYQMAPSALKMQTAVQNLIATSTVQGLQPCAQASVWLRKKMARHALPLSTQVVSTARVYLENASSCWLAMLRSGPPIASQDCHLEARLMVQTSIRSAHKMQIVHWQHAPRRLQAFGAKAGAGTRLDSAPHALVTVAKTLAAMHATTTPPR